MKKKSGIRNVINILLSGVISGIYRWLNTTNIIVKPRSASIYSIRLVDVGVVVIFFKKFWQSYEFCLFDQNSHFLEIVCGAWFLLNYLKS